MIYMSELFSYVTIFIIIIIFQKKRYNIPFPMEILKYECISNFFHNLFLLICSYSCFWIIHFISLFDQLIIKILLLLFYIHIVTLSFGKNEPDYIKHCVFVFHLFNHMFQLFFQFQCFLDRFLKNWSQLTTNLNVTLFVMIKNHV